MEQVDTKEIEQSRTPEALYRAIEKYSAVPEGLSRGETYRESRNALIRFRKVYSKLPALPDHQDNTIAGLQEVMDWYVRAIDIVDHMVDYLDRNIIEGFIRNLKKLRGLPASGFPKIDKNVWKKAEDIAQKICDKYQAGKKRPRGLGTIDYSYKRTKFLDAASIISSLANVANRKAGKSNDRSYPPALNSIAVEPWSKQIDDAYTEMYFYRSVEKIYRLMDSDYTTALAKLEKVFSLCLKSGTS